ncbi:MULTISPECIES: hypothetical protein [spotted fever group]|nr:MULTISPECIES: hypothetical protein [spotted fever group]
MPPTLAGPLGPKPPPVPGPLGLNLPVPVTGVVGVLYLAELLGVMS